MENELEKDNSQTSEEITPESEVVDDTPTLEDYQKVKEEKDALEAKNKQLYARIKTQSKPLTNTESKLDYSELEKRLEKKLELKSQGFTEEDITFINANGGDVNNPYVKNALDATRVQREAEKATEITSSGQSDIEKKYTNAELRSMSPSELEKILPRA